MTREDRRITFLTTVPLLVVGLICGVFGAVILWEESPRLATGVGLALFLIAALGGRLSIELSLGLMKVFIAIYEMQQNSVENVVSLTERKVDDIIRLSERDPRFGYADMQTFPRFRRRSPFAQAARRWAWKAAWFLFPMGLVFTIVTGCTSLVFEFVGIGYPNIVLATGGGLTVLCLVVAFGEPLFGNWQVIRKCRRMLRAADQVERRLGGGGDGHGQGVH